VLAFAHRQLLFALHLSPVECALENAGEDSESRSKQIGFKGEGGKGRGGKRMDDETAAAGAAAAAAAAAIAEKKPI
jgi:hypothetical protein